MIYDVLIIGAGASGLFAASNIKLKKDQHGLILNKAKSPGLKLLMAGSGQCNVTHSGDIKDFITHYGPSGKKIRPIIYNFNNKMLQEWFSNRNLPLISREDGKIFPKTMSSKTVLDLFLKEAQKNGFDLLTSRDVISLNYEERNGVEHKEKELNGSIYSYSYATPCYPSVTPQTNDTLPTDTLSEIHKKNCAKAKSNNIIVVTATGPKGKETYLAKKIIIATGGCSYPATGSDGAIFNAIKDIGLDIVPCRPALVPLSVENYPYGQLSGNAVKNACVSIYEGKQRKKNSPSIIGDVLMTHKDFSGPGILDISRYAHNGNTLDINWFPEKPAEEILSELNAHRNGNKRQLITVLSEYFSSLSNGHLRWICHRAKVDPALRFTDLKGDTLKTIISLITSDRFTISGTSGFKVAMATCGGISLSEVNTSTMECKKLPGIYLTGEVLDVDGDTGGYNLQFAFASAIRAALHINDNL